MCGRPLHKTSWTNTEIWTKCCCHFVFHISAFLGVVIRSSMNPSRLYPWIGILGWGNRQTPPNVSHSQVDPDLPLTSDILWPILLVPHQSNTSIPCFSASSALELTRTCARCIRQSFVQPEVAAAHLGVTGIGAIKTWLENIMAKMIDCFRYLLISWLGLSLLLTWLGAIKTWLRGD